LQLLEFLSIRNKCIPTRLTSYLGIQNFFFWK